MQRKGQYYVNKNFLTIRSWRGRLPVPAKKKGFIFRTSYFSEIVIGESFHVNRLHMKYLFFVKNEVCYETG